MAAPVAYGPGGSTVLENLRECDVLDHATEDVPVKPAPDAMFNENDSGCMGVYKRADFAGS